MNNDLVKVENLLTSTATSTTDKNSGTVFISGSRNHTLYVNWTPGAGSNVLTLSIQVSPDSSSVPAGSETWYTLASWAGTNHLTSTLYDLQVTAADTSAHKRVYSFTMNAKRIRVVYSETVSAGTLNLLLLSKEL